MTENPQGKRILITGGAGYIGTHVCKELLEEGHQVIVIDNLITGREGAMTYLQERYPNQLIFIKGDLINPSDIEGVLGHHQIDSVVHLAGSLSVRDSNSQPVRYVENNSITTLNLLNGMVKYGVGEVVFASTAAVYGKVDQSLMPIKETQPADPNSVYGITKLMNEQFLKIYEGKGIKHTILRFFNVMGADESGRFGYNTYPPEHLMQSAILNVLGMYPEFKLTYPQVNTRDGSTIRDYIHVSDIAHAIRLGLERHWSGEGRETSEIMNLGSEKGQSTLEIINAVEAQLGVQIPRIKGETRPGEDPMTIADPSKAKRVLGWMPERTLDEGIIGLRDWFMSREFVREVYEPKILREGQLPPGAKK